MELLFVSINIPSMRALTPNRDLSHNLLTALPSLLFAGLGTIKTLLVPHHITPNIEYRCRDLSFNLLTTLPEDIFSYGLHMYTLFAHFDLDCRGCSLRAQASAAQQHCIAARSAAQQDELDHGIVCCPASMSLAVSMRRRNVSFNALTAIEPQLLHRSGLSPFINLFVPHRRTCNRIPMQ